MLPSPRGCRGGRAVAGVRHPRTGRLGLFSGLRVLTLAARRIPCARHRRRRGCCVLPLAGSCDGRLRRRSASSWPGGDGVFSGVDRLRLPAPRIPRSAVSSQSGGRVRRASARARERAGRRGTARRAASRWNCAAPGPAPGRCNNFCMPGVFDGGPADRLRGAHPGGQLVVLPAAQARRGRGQDESGARGDLLLRDRGAAARRGLPARLRHARTGPSTCWPRSGMATSCSIPHGWHGPSMAAPGYHLYYLNVMAGPGAERAWLLLRRPGARLDPRHLARPAASTPGCPPRPRRACE